MIYDLEWRHPGVILFFLNLCIGAWAAYLESVRVPELFSQATYGLPWPLLLVGLIGLCWAPLYMIARPYEFLPARGLATDLEIYRKRENMVRSVGYIIDACLLVFILYRITQVVA